MEPRNRPTFRISLLALALMPAFFAGGWYARGLCFERDVQEAAQEIVMPIHADSITYVPELGLVFRPRHEFTEAWKDRQQEIDAQTPEQIRRRRQFFKRLRAGGFNGLGTETPHQNGPFVTQGVKPSE